MSHQSEGKPKSRLIETRELKKVRPIFEGSGEVVRLYDQFKKIFEKTGEYRLFAEPVIAEGQRNFISWYTDLEGEIRSYNDLDEKEKEKIKGQLKHQVDRMRGMAGELSKNETFNRALDNSLEVPALENSVFFVGDRVVLVEWGLIRDEFKPPRGIIKNLIAVEPPEIKTAAMQIQTVYPDGEPAPGVSLEIRYPGNRIETETGSGGIVQLEEIPLETVVEVRVKQQRQGDIEKQFTCTGMGQYPPIVVEDMREKEVILPPPPPPPSPPPPEPGPGIEKETKKRGLWWLWLLLLILILAALIALLRNCHCGKETVPPIVGTPSVPLKNIAITVSDAETGNPIEGAGITVGHEGKRSDGKTDTLGVVEFRDMPEGTALTVFVAAPGYEEKSETLTCCTSHKIRLKPLPSLTPISPSKSIVFTILDANTVQPIESAKVTISFNNQKIDKPTNDQGVVEFPDIPANTQLDVFIKANGYEEKKETLADCTDQEFKLTPLVLPEELKIELLWNSSTDLDLHVKTPCGDEIFRKNKTSSCSGYEGELEKDSNVDCKDENSNETISWKKAHPGKYVVEVELYKRGNQSDSNSEINFTVRITNRGRITTYSGKVSGEETYSSNKVKKVQVPEFPIEVK